MSTFCFDIKRCDPDHVCIQHADHNRFDYFEHHPFSHWNNVKGYETEDYGDDYRRVFVVIAKDRSYEDIERIIWVTDSKKHALEILAECKNPRTDMFNVCHHDLRLIELTYEVKVTHHFTEILDHEFSTYVERDMGDEFKLYCPTAANERHCVYGHYVEVPAEDTSDKDDKDKFMSFPKEYKFIPVEYLD